MFTKALAEGFSGMFDLKSKLDKRSFFIFAATLAVVFMIVHAAASAAGQGVSVAINAVFAFPVISAFWRRRNDAGVVSWFSIFWLLPLMISAIGVIVGPPVPKPVPTIDPGLGDAGLLLFLTPQFGNAASVSIENSTNKLIYNATYTFLPGLLFFTLLVIEIIFCVRPSSTGKGR